MFSASVAPIFLLSSFYLIRHLDEALFYLQDSIRQEKLLNQNMQETIRQLNFEIEERKKAFQAKRRAIDELRKEISERKKTQQELEEQSLLMRSIVDSSPDLFYYRDETGRFASCNKMFEQLIGKSAVELIGPPVRDQLGIAARGGGDPAGVDEGQRQEHQREDKSDAFQVPAHRQGVSGYAGAVQLLVRAEAAEGAKDFEKWGNEIR